MSYEGITVEVYREHAKTCEKVTGGTIEDEIITCAVNGETGECMKHDMDYSGDTIEIRCEGCEEVLWSKDAKIAAAVFGAEPTKRVRLGYLVLRLRDWLRG